jgi:hypothetical protein
MYKKLITVVNYFASISRLTRSAGDIPSTGEEKICSISSPVDGISPAERVSREIDAK